MQLFEKEGRRQKFYSEVKATNLKTHGILNNFAS